MEDAPDLASKIGLERGVIAGAELASAARLLGKSADERDAARKAVEVVRSERKPWSMAGGTRRSGERSVTLPRESGLSR